MQPGHSQGKALDVVSAFQVCLCCSQWIDFFFMRLANPNKVSGKCHVVRDLEGG